MRQICCLLDSLELLQAIHFAMMMTTVAVVERCDLMDSARLHERVRMKQKSCVSYTNSLPGGPPKLPENLLALDVGRTAAGN